MIMATNIGLKKQWNFMVMKVMYLLGYHPVVDVANGQRRSDVRTNPSFPEASSGCQQVRLGKVSQGDFKTL